MNVLGKRERSWRKARKRGVSPIIATILLVAITVVLAAVLYVLISGLTTGPGNAPLGSHFGWGTPSNTSAGTALTYTVGIASASGVSVSNLNLGLHSPSGNSLALATYISTIVLVNAQGSTVATYSVSNGAGTAVTGFNGVLSAGMSIQITAAKGLFGDSLVGIGVGSYSGTVTSSAFP